MLTTKPWRRAQITIMATWATCFCVGKRVAYPRDAVVARHQHHHRLGAHGGDALRRHRRDGVLGLPWRQALDGRKQRRADLGTQGA